MVLATMSTLVGRNEREEVNCNKEVTFIGRKHAQQIKELETKTGTEINGVPIKKELIEESLNKKSTDTQILIASSDDEEREYVPGEPEAQRDRKLHYSQGRTDRRSADRKTVPQIIGTGKRRLQITKTSKRNKKYFQDIRAYARIPQLDEQKMEHKNEKKHMEEKLTNKMGPTDDYKQNCVATESRNGPLTTETMKGIQSTGKKKNRHHI